MLSTIKAAIKKHSNNNAEFAKEVGIREATLSEFLNEKVNINFDTLSKIMKGANLEIAEKKPNILIELDFVIIKGEKYKIHDYYDKKRKIIFCFGSSSTTYQGIIVKKLVDSKLELIIL